MSTSNGETKKRGKKETLHTGEERHYLLIDVKA